MFASSHTMKKHPGQVAGIAGISIGLGALAAILFTPRRGSEVRSGIKRRSILMKDKAVKMKHNETEAAKDAVKTAKSTAKTAASKAKGTAEKIKEDSKDVAEEIRRNGEP
jgi:gas vesicle protein